MNKFYLPERSQVVNLIATPGLNIISQSMIIVLTLALGFLWLNTGRAKSATLEYITGKIQVTASRSSDKLRTLTGDMRVREGQQIRVGGASSARLVFNDGSRVMLDSSVRLRLEELSGSQPKNMKVVLIQDAGTTRHTVISLSGEDSKYQVVTPYGTISVRGGSFSVSVDEGDYARFSVDSGRATVQQNGTELTVTAGQAVVVHNGVLDRDVAYQFILAGPLPENYQANWSVNGVSFLVTQNTHQTGDLQVGAYVLVEGRIVNGQRIADRIQVLPGGEALSYITGIFEERGKQTWNIGGSVLTVNDSTIISGVPKEKEALLVVFKVMPEGNWTAKSIIALGETVETPWFVATAVYTPTPTSTPTFTPTATSTSTPANTQAVAQVIVPTPTGTASPTATPYIFVSRPPRPAATSTPYSSGGQPPVAAPTFGPSYTPTKTSTRTPTPTMTRTPTSTVTGTLTSTLTPSATSTRTPTPTATRTPTITPSPTFTRTPTITPTRTPTFTPTITPTPTMTFTPSITPTPRPTNTPRPTATLKPTSTPKISPTPTATGTPTDTPTYTPTLSPSDTPTLAPIPTDTYTPVPLPTDTPIPTDTPTDVPTATLAPPTDAPTPTDTVMPLFGITWITHAR
jgi:hypothetical protein